MWCQPENLVALHENSIKLEVVFDPKIAPCKTKSRDLSHQICKIIQLEYPFNFKNAYSPLLMFSPEVSSS